jgi:hypothetical protein
MSYPKVNKFQAWHSYFPNITFCLTFQYYRRDHGIIFNETYYNSEKGEKVNGEKRKLEVEKKRMRNEGMKRME